MKCWAASVSACCDTQSREHYLTKGLFKGKTLHVTNAPFLENKSITISKNSLTKKCLCKRHNELLAVYDEEAIKFARSLEYASELSLKRRKLDSTRFSVHQKRIDIDKFCRWYIKTFLGLLEFFDHPSRIEEEFLAKLVYGSPKIKNNVILSIEMAAGNMFNIAQAVSVAPLYENDTTVGLEMVLYGIRIRGIFTIDPRHNQKRLKLNFREQKQGPSCVIYVE